MKKGEALITLLVVVVIATTVIAGAVSMSIINTKSTSSFALSQESLKIAEAGAEHAILNILRNPNYSGENLSIGTGSANISITGTNPITITSTGVSGEFIRKVSVVVDYSNNVLTVNNWGEIN